MAIYHLEAKVVSRGAGRSAVAASAYLSCSRLYNDYDGIQHDYTKKQGLVWQEVFLPEYAPQEWQDREQLWNAVEEVETAKDSRLAREFVVALPIELSREEQVELLQEFIREQFVSDGMCADAAIHDTDGHNPHAHILLTVRPLDERGKWQYKTEKEYLCMKNGEERGFTAAEFRAAQNEGWEKQYPYKVGKKKVYMTPPAAEAQGLVRADKHPKSTRYGRQNPISERWNSEEQLLTWRAAWADVSNRHLERAGREERIDHRSNAARGLDEIPTIHEGVTAQALERKGIISDRCELNRQIKADNALLRELKAAVKKLGQTVKNTLPVIAEAMEKLRSHVLIFCYQLSHIRGGKSHIQKSLSVWKPELERYTGLVQQIKEKSKERKALVAEKKELPIYHVKRHKALTVRIAELKAQATNFDPVELHDARQAIRPEKELNAVEQLQRAYGDKYRPLAMLDSKRKASGLLHEYADEQAVQKLKRAQQQKIQSEHTPPNQRKNESTLNVKLRLDATFFTDKRNRHNTISEAGHVRTLADLISLIYFYHTIAHTNMCLDVLRGLLCWLQLFPQCCHKYPQRSYIVIPTAAPDILCDKGMGQYLANILGQQAQQLILNGRQVQFVVSQISAPPSIIYFQFTINKYRTGGYHFRRHQGESALRYPKSCQQFFYRKGLCQIIVRSGIQRLDFIVILASGADYNNRNIRPRANRLNDLNAIHIRQAQIQ